MLATFRNAAQGWVAKIFLALIVVSFGVWGITDVFRGFQVRDVATVGDQAISGEDYRTTLNRTLQSIGQQSGSALSLEDARKMGLDQQVLDRMVASAALDAQGQRLSVALSDQAIAAQVAANPAFHNAQGQFDPDKFRSLLQQNGLTEPVFLASQKRDLTRDLLSKLASNSPQLPKTLQDALLRYKDERRDARYVSFSVNETDVPEPTAEELKKHYESNPVAYTAPEYRSVAMIKVEPADIAGKTQVSEDEVKAFYDAHLTDYFTPEKRNVVQLSFRDMAQATAAKARVDKGEDIVKVAESLGMKQGDVVFDARAKSEFIDPKIADVAFGLKEGQLSDPVQGALTIALLKVTKITPEKQSTLDEVRAPVTEKVKLEKAQEELQSVYDTIEDARAQEMKFEEIAQRAGLPLTIVPAVSQAGTDKKGTAVTLPFRDEVLKAAYGSDVGVENDALTIGDVYVWYEVREVIPSALRPLDEVKDAVKADWKAGKLRSLAADKAKALVAKAGATPNLDAIATELKSTVKTITGIVRNQTSADFDGPATTALFSVPQKALTWSLEGDGRSARIIEVTRVDLPASTAAPDESKKLVDQIRDGIGSDLMESYVKAVKAETKVTINDELWQQIRGSSAP